MKAMVGLIDEVMRLNNKCSKLESETDQIKQEIKNLLRNIRNLSDDETLSVGSLRNTLENLLEEGSEPYEATPQALT